MNEWALRLDYLVRLVVGLPVAAEHRRHRARVELLDVRRDLGVFALEQRVAVEVAFDEERAEIRDLEHPQALREAQLFEPIGAGDALNAAAEQSSCAVADG